MKRKWNIFLSILTACILILAYMFIEPYWLKITYMEIRDGDIPNSFDGKRIVFVSDIHHGPFFPERESEIWSRKSIILIRTLFLSGEIMWKKADNI